MLNVQPNMSQRDPSVEEKREQLERLLHSRVFHGSGLLATLLQYLVSQSFNEPDIQPKEYTIALEVFKRGSEFDPRTNSIVRVHAKRLRTKLQEYYETEGESDRVLIDLPKGHYRVAFSYATAKADSALRQEPQTETAPPSESAPPEVEFQPRDIRADFTRAVLISLLVILSVVVVLLAFSNINPRSGTQPSLPNIEAGYETVWSPFLKSNTSTLLVLSNPAVFRFLNNSDSEVTSKQAAKIPPEQARMFADELKDKLVMKQGRPLRLVLSTSSYTGIGEAIGLYHVTSLFRSTGRELRLKQSRTVTAEDLKKHNVILLGSAWVNAWVEKLPVKEDFIYSVNASILNNEPLAGEKSEYKPKYNEQTGDVEEDYAIITVKPGVTDEHRLMILAGLLSEGTQAAAECVTKKEYLDALSQRLQHLSDKDGPPKYYQVLLKVAVDNGIPTTVSILAVHPLKVTRN